MEPNEMSGQGRARVNLVCVRERTMETNILDGYENIRSSR